MGGAFRRRCRAALHRGRGARRGGRGTREESHRVHIRRPTPGPDVHHHITRRPRARRRSVGRLTLPGGRRGDRSAGSRVRRVSKPTCSGLKEVPTTSIKRANRFLDIARQALPAPGPETSMETKPWRSAGRMVGRVQAGAVLSGLGPVCALQERYSAVARVLSGLAVFKTGGGPPWTRTKYLRAISTALC